MPAGFRAYSVRRQVSCDYGIVLSFTYAYRRHCRLPHHHRSLMCSCDLRYLCLCRLWLRQYALFECVEIPGYSDEYAYPAVWWQKAYVVTCLRMPRSHCCQQQYGPIIGHSVQLSYPPCFILSCFRLKQVLLKLKLLCK